jgi:TolB-like protein/DNA-binding winged helix-turn-helix (wHTH) protein/tetratricopeptide (TPR) repeat protein
MSNPPEPASIDLAHEADFRLGNLDVHPSVREIVSAKGNELLEPRVMQVLVALARRRGRIVSRDDLIRDCWEGRIVGEDALNRCIGRIRRIAEAGGGFALETVPRVGYRLLETAAVPPADQPAPAKYHPFHPYVLPTAVIVAIVLVGLGFAFVFLRPVPAPTAPNAPTVAVLPFDALGSQDDLRVFGDAVAEQIIGVLSDNQVQSISRAASAGLRGANRDAAATSLGAAFIVDGTVTHGDAGLHVTVHLDHVATHATLWTATFDQKGADATMLQTQVAAPIVDAIRSALRAHYADGRPIEDAPLANYINGMANVREGPAKGRAQKARDLFQAVIAQAPDFSLGHSSLAISSALTANDRPDADDAASLRDVARTEAVLALTLDPHNGEAYIAIYALRPTRDWAGREEILRRGLAAQPDDGSVTNFLANVLDDEGRVREALTLIERAAMLDPLSPVKHAGLARALASAGRCTEALTELDRTRKTWPSQVSVWGATGHVFTDCGHLAEARAALATPPATITDEPLVAAAWRTYVDALEPAATPDTKARAVTAIVTAVQAHVLYENYGIEMLAHVGAIDQAFALADEVYRDNRHPAQIYPSELFYQPSAALWRDARFMPLMQRLGLAAYWRQTGHWPDFCATPGLPYDCRKAL